MLVAVALLLAACTGDDGSDDAAPTERPATLTVVASPTDALADEVVAVEVTGAQPGAEVRVEVTSTDEAGVEWSSTTRSEATDDGRVVIGDGPMEPFTTLAPADPGAAYTWGLGATTFTVTATADGHRSGTAEVRRRLVADGVTAALTDPATDDGVVGALWSPAPDEATGSAVLVIGGSEGGVPTPELAAAFASHGITTLAIASFGTPGLPDELAEIPLETFVTGLGWLADRPGVVPDRVWVYGASRGTEAAVLVAARHPELVAGVVLGAPSSVVNSGFPDDTRPAWTDGGVPVPDAPFGTVGPAPDPAADLPIEDVDGPVIATCGGEDRLWPACRHAEALFERRDGEARPEGDALAEDISAGHRVAAIVPFLPLGRPLAPTGGPIRFGGDPLADDRVRAEAWPLILEALGAEAP